MHLTQNCKCSFDLSSRRGRSGTTRQSLEEFFRLKSFINPEISTSKGYDIGDKVTDFKLKNTDETFVSLADFTEAKGYIVIFTCNHCPYSIAYEDRIIALQTYPITKS